MDQTGQPYAYTGDDPVNETDPLGLAGGPACQSCEELATQIQNLTNELSQRRQELLENKLNLPPTGPMSIGGHQQQFENKQAQLRGLLNEWESGGCGQGLTLPSNAWNWATMPTPAPSPGYVPSNSNASSPGFHVTKKEVVGGVVVGGLVVLGIATGGVGDLIALAF